MIFVVSGTAAELVSALLATGVPADELLEKVFPASEPESLDDRAHEELLESVTLESLDGWAHEELLGWFASLDRCTSAEVLLPSSPQATSPNAVANTPNKLEYFIFPAFYDEYN